jgi:hypothetical protein
VKAPTTAANATLAVMVIVMVRSAVPGRCCPVNTRRCAARRGLRREQLHHAHADRLNAPLMAPRYLHGLGVVSPAGRVNMLSKEHKGQSAADLSLRI